MSSLDDLIAQNSAQQAPSAIDSLISKNAGVQGVPQQQPAAQPQTQQSTQQGAQPANWQVPNSVVMGMGDSVRGYGQSIVHGLSWLADKVAPESQFAKDARAALPQIQQTIDQQNAQYAAANPNAGTDWGRIGGQVGGMALIGGGGAAAPESLAGKAVMGALSGLGGTAAQPVANLQPGQTYADAKLDQAKTNALIGAFAGPATGIVGSAISGVGGAAQRRLADAGVTMTPGQILGPAAARTEEKLTSVPIIGDFIKNAQNRSVQSFNRAAYDNALEPVGQALPRNTAIGSDAVAAVRDRIGQVYNSIEPRASFVADQNFNADVNAIRNNLAQNAPGTLQQFDNIVANQVTNKLQHGYVLDGHQWGATRSEISTMARNQTLGNATPDNRALAGALGDLNDAINSGVARSSPPDVLQDLGRANAAWARYKQIENAAGSAGASNNGNVFTAAQFQNAIRRGSTSGQKATNSGLNGQFGADAQDILGGAYPNSGTPGRAALMAALGALGGHAVLPPNVAAPAIGAGAAAALPYTALGQRATQALLMSRPAGFAPVGDALSRYGVPFSAALGAALVPSVSGGQ